jgi:8-amino-7-oxononanoate synthase
MLQWLDDDLRALAERGRLRALRPRSGIDFTSNDYLGLAESEELQRAAVDALQRGVPIGSGGSRLLRGNHPEHEALKSEAAAFFGAEAALYFGAGYVANMAIFSTLPQRGDLVVHDELIHASAHEGLRRSRAESLGVAHNDADAFKDAISRWRRAGGIGQAWIAVESLYSMDGDSPRLAELLAVAERYDAMLVVDEAHATGVLGRMAAGWPRHSRAATTSSRCIPAARRWGRSADSCWARAGSATSWSIARALSSLPLHRRR